jgi:hypothetical protein
VISRRVDVYFLRFVEIANTCVFLYVSWALGAHDMVGLRLQRSRLENGLNDFVPLLAAAPFLLAFVLLFRKELTPPQWLLIRAMHQALAIVTIAIAAISLVGLPDTVLATICVTVFALLQVGALKASRQFVPGASHVQRWPIRVLRVAMVFLFAFLFLLMK